MADSPGSGSPLSSHASSEFVDDVKQEENETSYGLDGADALAPPSKRQKLGGNAYGSSDAFVSPLDGDISSDTTGSAPSSPLLDPLLSTEDDDLEQVTVCRWRDCTVGDLGNMDELVKHIHETHMPEKQKKWICEWEKCSRMDLPHASGYALRAHMRSHTKEKPFFCKLPECDRSFTRSDALLKHMRTQHETEVLRHCIDPNARGQGAGGSKPQRLKLILKPNGVKENGTTEDSGAQPETEHNFLLDLGLTEQELSQPRDKLYRVLHHHLAWHEEANEKYKASCKELETRHRYEWESKELVLANLTESEIAVAQKRVHGDDAALMGKVRTVLLPKDRLPIEGSTWFRKA